MIIMTSPDAILKGGTPDRKIVKLLITANATKIPVGVISNHTEPPWFQTTFAGSGVQFIYCPGRQDGRIVAVNATNFHLKPHNVLVLATKDEDVQMGKNGRAVLVAAGWSTNQYVKALGIRIDDALQFQEIINLTREWSGHWWHEANAPSYNVRALANLSGYGVSNVQQAFGKLLTNTVKEGGSRLNALLTVTARSILNDGMIAADNLVWGVYPSSNSSNDDNEVLSDFTHRLRTTVSRVHFAKKDVPLFIRHKQSSKRSMGGSVDRNDPSEQLLTLHLNPFYKKNGRLVEKNVIIVDDCTTYGVSFGVAAAFLQKAGARSVTGIALGKFGNQLAYHEIEINSDPFAPIRKSAFSCRRQTLNGKNDDAAQEVLRELI